MEMFIVNLGIVPPFMSEIFHCLAMEMFKVNLGIVPPFMSEIFTVLAMEMFKVNLGIAPPFMSEIFRKRNLPINSVANGLRNPSEFYNFSNPKTVHYGTETLGVLGPKIWNILPNHIKNSSSLEVFKRTIKKWIPVNYPCRICRPYLPCLGFMQHIKFLYI